ncbi:MAG: PH domain-containing protein [Bacteroidales bacterium]|nr:PH domain-containing protein [Bacteroidales bacterium]MBN2820104.1 PH domain-containing protein [Bacteroidales bacterium]
MPELFTCKKSKGFGVFILLASVVIIFVSIGIPLISDETVGASTFIPGLVVAILISGFFLWFWLNTKYIIVDQFIKVIWGPFRWKINITDIKLIRLNQETFAGIVKPTLSWRCMEIRYKKYKSISISPVDEKKFLDYLVKVNRDIQIKD